MTTATKTKTKSEPDSKYERKVLQGLPTLIGLCGPLGGGKSTAAKILFAKYGYTRMRFAGPLKEMLATIGLNTEQLDGSRKSEPDSKLLCGKTPRWAMQSIGTEWGRKLIGEDIWVNVVREKIISLRQSSERAGLKAMVVIDDVRFPNEVAMIRDLGGVLIKIYGRTPETKPNLFTRALRLFGLRQPHLSEVYWKTIKADDEIWNGPNYRENDLEDLLDGALDMCMRYEGTYDST